MPENVSIAYRGANYAIGQGRQFYGIWPAQGNLSQPLERWPLTPAGWTGAWNRFAAIEVPGTITSLLPGAAPVAQGPVAQGPVAQGPVAQGPVADAHAAQTAAGGPAAEVPAAGLSAGAAGLNSAGTVSAEPSGPAESAQPAGTSGPAGEKPPVYWPAGLGAVPGGAVPGGAVPGGAVPSGVVSAPLAPARRGVSAALLGIGVVLGLVGLFPAYLAGDSLASQPFNVLAHAIYLAAWTASAALIVAGGSRARAGALLGIGTSAVTLGFFLADVGTAMTGGAHLAGLGLWLSIAGWAACAAGAAAAVIGAPDALGGRAHGTDPGGRFRRGGQDIVPAVSLVVAAVGAAIAFAPSWDRFTLQVATGASQTITAGNAFSNPALVIAGDVFVMVALVAVIVAAVLARSARLGIALAAGAVVPMAAQAISAIVQITEPVSAAQFGISPSQAAALGLRIDNGLTPVFWVYCAFTVTLILLCLQIALASSHAEQNALGWGVPYPPTPYSPPPYPLAAPYPPVAGRPAGPFQPAAGQQPGQAYPPGGPTPGAAQAPRSPA